MDKLLNGGVPIILTHLDKGCLSLATAIAKFMLCLMFRNIAKGAFNIVRGFWISTYILVEVGPQRDEQMRIT